MDNKEKNRFVSGAGYCVFAFLFGGLVIAGQLCFNFVALVSLLLGQSIVSQAIGGALSTKREVVVGLLGLFLWKLSISFQKCYITDINSQVFSSLKQPFYATK